ncbi:MAG TPA: choice-of-anchor B family protein [Pyrinomonadaceae bacterium]|nr:choice-of-anchor B family protein [Pyrinomonadaceae bacterium]
MPVRQLKRSRRRLRLAFAFACVAALASWPTGAHEGEHHSPGGNGQPDNRPLAAMSLTPCVNGMAATFPCRDIDLASFLPLADIGGGTANDVWGWTDPQTGREYALLGRSSGVSFVDITTPEQPVYLGNLPTHTVDSLWRGLKVYRNHLYVISEAADHGLQVFDLTRLRNVAAPPVNFTETAHYAGFTTAHTLAINEETGFAYAAGTRQNPALTDGAGTCSGRGLHVLNLRNPQSPAFAGCVDADGYTHETQCVVYRGPDAEHRGREICFSANEDTLTIVDVTDKGAPAQLSRNPYEGRGYTHQGWLTEDHRNFLLDDELDERSLTVNTRTFVWDVTDLDAPLVRAVHQGVSTSIDHNLYVRGRFAFESNYRSGLRVLDAAGAGAGILSEVAFFDVYPLDDQPLFNGTWSNYPFFASGVVVASGIEQGLFVLRPRVGMPVRIDYAPFFVRQHYRDFFGRDADEAGLGFWSHEIASCVADANCTDDRRNAVSAAFFLSTEFQQTGYLLHRLHAASFANLPRFQPFITDLRSLGDGVVVGQTGWEQRLAQNRETFLREWVARAAFVAEHPTSLTASDYVARLFANAGVAPTQGERSAAVAAFGAGGAEGRALALASVAESASVYNRQYNSAFVLMQYFGYLRRNPNDPPNTDLSGYHFWLAKLDSFSLPGEDVRNELVARARIRRAEMVRSFLVSGEYRARFGQ